MVLKKPKGFLIKIWRILAGIGLLGEKFGKQFFYNFKVNLRKI